MQSISLVSAHHFLHINNNFVILSDFSSVSRKKVKQEILRNSLESQLEEASGYKLLDLYAAFYELNDVKTFSIKVKQIELRCSPLGADGAHALSSLMTSCGNLDHVDLNGCQINNELWRIMAENMKDHKVHVSFCDLFS